MSHTPSCASCGAPAAPLACSRCKSAFYCSGDCQKDAWGAHKPDCKRIAASWGPSDEAQYGAWASRVSLLLAARPQYQVVRFSAGNVFVSIGGALQPLVACTSISSPELAPAVALEVLALALEARSFARAARSGGGRTKRYNTAFNLFKLAASPSTTMQHSAPNIGEMKEPISRAECAAAVECAMEGVPDLSSSSPERLAPSGGNAEAQFRMGQCYAEGLMGVCSGHRLMMPAALWMHLAASQGHAQARAWVDKHVTYK